MYYYSHIYVHTYIQSCPTAGRAGTLLGTKHGCIGAVSGLRTAGLGRLRGGQLAGYKMTATSEVKHEVTLVKGAAQIEGRLGKLRTALKEEALDALIVLSSDAHHSEYPAERDRCMLYISGFSGSAGTVMVTADGGPGVLVTDGRYTIQAAQELDASMWKVMQVGARMPTMPEHLRTVLGDTPKEIGVDASTVSLGTWRSLEKALHPHILVALRTSPLATLWEGDASSTRPSLPTAQAAEHPIKYAGVSSEDKLAQVRKALKSGGADAMAISSLDEVAWLLNIRGSDVAYCPVVMSHAAVTPTEAFLFVDSAKLDSHVRKHVEAAGYTLKPYADFIPTLTALASTKLKFWVDDSVTRCIQAERERQTDKIDRWIDRKPDIDTQTDREREREGEIEGERQRETEREFVWDGYDE